MLQKRNLIPFNSQKVACRNVKTFIYLKDFIYLFMRDTQRGRGRSRLPAGNLMQDSIQGPQDHALS